MIPLLTYLHIPVYLVHIMLQIAVEMKFSLDILIGYLLQLRSVMDPKRHYKKGDSQTAKYFQVRINK